MLRLIPNPSISLNPFTYYGSGTFHNDYSIRPTLGWPGAPPPPQKDEPPDKCSYCGNKLHGNPKCPVCGAPA
jgi:hypothetical protein